MALIDELKEQKQKAHELYHGFMRDAFTNQSFADIEAQRERDLDTAIAALEPAPAAHLPKAEWADGFGPAEPDTDTGVWKQEELDEINARRFDRVMERAVAQVDAEAVSEPEPEPSLFDAEDEDEPDVFISDLTGDPAIEPESGLHGEPVDKSPIAYFTTVEGCMELRADGTLHNISQQPADPEPTELDAEPLDLGEPMARTDEVFTQSIVDDPELLAAVARAEATLAARVWKPEDLERLPQIEPEPAYIGLQDPDLDAEYEAMRAREEAEKPKPRFSIFGRFKEDA